MAEPKVKFAVVTFGPDGQPDRTWCVDHRITQIKRFISNRRFLDDYTRFHIMQGTSALDWVEVRSDPSL